ncbi:MAG: hypothetical protein KGJ82_03635 [Nitrospirota bacterium]|nr:hypothetical protein [Nitrospirota bacterium]
MSTNAATLLARLNNELAQPVRHDLSTDSLNRWLGWLTKLQSRIEQVAATIKPLMSNASYSDTGRAAQIADLATASIPQFAWLGNLGDDLDNGCKRSESQLLAVESPIKDPILRELRAQEGRSDLRDLAPHEIDAAFLKASQEDRDEIMWALLNSPTGPMVSDDMQARALTDRAQRLQPDLYATWKDLELLRDSMTSWRQHISLWLTGLGAAPQLVADTLRLPYADQPGFQPPQLKGPEWARAILASVA